MHRVRRLIVLPVVALAAAVVAALVATTMRVRLADAWRRLRTSSSPSVALYEVLAGAFLAGYYDEVARDCLRVLEGIPAATVLEVGPGPGHLAETLLGAVPDLTWTGLDVDPAMLAATRRRLAPAGLAERATFVEADVSTMPFDDASFDLVVSSLSAHHWADPGTAFDQIRRVLRPGATALVYDVPAAWGRLETGSSGIAAANGPDVSPVGRVRGIGPIVLICRVEMRRTP